MTVYLRKAYVGGRESGVSFCVELFPIRTIRYNVPDLALFNPINQKYDTCIIGIDRIIIIIDEAK